MLSKLKPYFIYIGMALLVGLAAGLISSPAMEDFAALKQPPLSPPGSVFPIVWTILYILMGIGAGLVATGRVSTGNPALKLYMVQLIFNFGWTIIFFNLKLRLVAFIWLLALLGLVISMTVHFYKVRPLAGLLQIPYILWLIFAAYLNFAIFSLNG